MSNISEIVYDMSTLHKNWNC